MIDNLSLRHRMFLLAGMGTIAMIIVVLADIVFGTSDFEVFLHVPLMAAAAAAMFGVAHYLGRHAGRRAERMVGALNRMADGRLDEKLDIPGKDEFSWMAYEFSRAQGSVSSLVAAIQTASEQMSSAVGHVDTVVRDTKEGVDAQRSDIDQVAAAMNEMATTVQEVAQHISNAANVAGEADEASRDGGRVLERTVTGIESLASEVRRTGEAVQHLESEASEIGMVLNVIRGIAEQTNLLALNAAIEAARAGEKGRGFSVVAEEVRTLATRTQESTSQVQDIIERLQKGTHDLVEAMAEGQNQASQSVEQAKEAGAAFDSIAGLIRSINDMNAQIASAAEEQTSVAEEINQNLSSIASVSEQSYQRAAGAEQATDDLNGVSEQLRSTVSRFRV